MAKNCTLCGGNLYSYGGGKRYTLVYHSQGNDEVTLLPEYVEEGDTLWGMSKNYAGDMDIRDYITRVMDVNRLSSVNIKPGELLYFPAYE